ncbi:MAG TPA: type VI secretion system-associated FHA domain protein [Polyangiaceae bacterium]|nr:type VI secretion system-associated FHA domain protein [Polyangiaceae bacterium]
MPRGFILYLQTLDNTPVGERRAPALPIRIGRNPLNDCQVSQNFISDFHAIIEEVSGRISVRDLNSKNGIFVRTSRTGAPTRVASQASVDLAAYDYEFFVGPFLRVKLEFTESDSDFPRDPRSMGPNVLGRMLDVGLGTPPNLSVPSFASGTPNASSPPPFAPGGPPNFVPYPGGAAGGGGSGGLPSLPNMGSLPSLDPSRGRASAPPMNGPPGYTPPGHAASPGPPPYGPAGYAPYGQPSAPPPGYGAQPYPPYGASPAAPAAPGGSPAGFAGTGHIALSLEALALQGLRELTSSLVPGVPLETTGDVARLITKLHDTVEVFCRCFIPLREGYAQFVSQMDLQRAAMQRSVNRSRGYMAIESAKHPGAVAMALLHWREPSFDAPKAIEGIFADLMIHQVALLDGVMQGVRALLDELSPDNIEKLLDAREPRGPLGLHLSMGRYKAVWEVYRERFEQLSEEKQAFSHIFGPEFTEAYREYRHRRTHPGGNT